MQFCAKVYSGSPEPQVNPGSPCVNCLYKYHILSLWHTLFMGHTANFGLVRFHV